MIVKTFNININVFFLIANFEGHALDAYVILMKTKISTLVGIGGGEYRSVQKKRRVAVQESESKKIQKKLSNVAKIFFTNFVSNLPNTILNSATSIYFAIIVSPNISQIFQNFISFY